MKIILLTIFLTLFSTQSLAGFKVSAGPEILLERTMTQRPYTITQGVLVEFINQEFNYKELCSKLHKYESKGSHELASAIPIKLIVAKIDGDQRRIHCVYVDKDLSTQSLTMDKVKEEVEKYEKYGKSLEN